MPEPQLRGLEPVFQCNVPQADHTPSLERHFHEFQVNIGPDPEDLFDEVEGLPDLLDIEKSDDESNSETKNPLNEEETPVAPAIAEEQRPGKEREAPLQPAAKQALEDLTHLLNPK